MNDHELIKLKKELQRKQELLKQQREDRQSTEKRLVEVQAQRDRFHSELVIARQSIENVNLIIDQNIKELKSKMEQEHSESFQQLQRLKDKVVEEKLLRERIQEQLKNKQTVISELSLRLREMSRKYKDPSLLVNTKEVADQAAITNNNYYKLTEKYNKLCSDMDNILAENKILRKLHGVPENFGFDLQEIKIAEKQQLEDYKAQCRKLQSEVQELQAQRTQLRYRLRQYNTLYSNKGERYKDLTQQHLQMLDLYALNLKEGKVELPQIDKSQKQMERQIIKLKAQIQVLQNKSAPNYQPKSSSSENEKISIQALNKMQQQITKLINPIRDEMRRIAEMKVAPGAYDDNHSKVYQNSDSKFDGPQYRPPMPLPHSHNDWTHIKEGFSYLYNSKIPIEFKDLMDQTGFNIAKAKYEIAALQLQNIQSLKLLKEKQNTETKLSEQVSGLRVKYEKCIKVQDELFLKYFKEKEEVNQRIKQLQIQKYSLNSQKEVVQTNLATISASFNALTKKTDIQKKLTQFTSRLAINEAELIKLRRKYQVLTDEHKLLRTSYSNLQSKTAANEYALKEKIAFIKKNEKELTFYLNKILNDSKESVSGDIHKILLNKTQCMNDKALNNSIKETELRLRINRLQNIERQINLKDDVIQTLREDNFDINMELEIIKNRLQATDRHYQAFQDVFRKLIKFINDNNISMVTYFKKFDKNGSGELSKNQFLSAIKALGFEITNQEFQLLFAQFDLDGSQTITYKEFLRKLRRSGVSTKNKEQEAIYRLFKAIKQANISVRKAYQIIDMDNSNSITKSQMETAFRKIGIDISMNTIEYIFKMCDDDQSGKIECNQFEKLFEDIVRESAIEEKQLYSTELDWKLGFVLKMQQISTKYHKGGLKETFNTLDKDGNMCMTMNELSTFFKQCGIELPKKEQLQLFQFLDRERDGKVQYLQFLKILEEARNEKKRIDRLRYIKIRTEQLRKENQLNSIKQSQNPKLSQEKSLSIKMMALQTKHTSLLKKSEKLIKAIAFKEQQLSDSKKQNEQLQQNVLKIQGEYYKEKELSISFSQKIKNRISEQQSKRLKLDINKIQINENEITGQLQLYKKLYEGLTNKNKYDEMRIVKTQSELQKYYSIVKELQSTSDLNAQIGKKIYELQISKRNQEVVNKKYEQLIQEIRSIHSQNIKLSQENMDKERQIINIHYFAQEKSHLMQRNIDQLNGKILPTVNPHKIEEILLKIREISNSKTALQKENKELRELNFNIQIKNDYLENEKIHIQQLQKKLKRTYGDQSSLTIIELTKKLSQYKMAELKAKRQCGLLKEKEEYFLRVNNAHVENIKELQEQLAGWQKKYNERQQFWRKSKAEQMKLMEDIQKQASKNRQEQRKAEVYFSQKEIQENKMNQMIQDLPEQKQNKLSSVIRRTSHNPNQNIVIELKGKIQQLEQELMVKEKEIYQLKTSFKEIVPQMRLSDFSGQMGASTANFVMQTELTTSQLRNNARRFINSQKDQENYYKEEALKVTQAAQQSIDTLQRIIDDKNDQLRRKDQVIENLKKQFLKNKEEDCKQIQMLNEQIRDLRTKVQTTSINEIMSRPTRQNFYPSNSKNDEVFELRKLIDKKEEEIKIMQQKYDKLYINKEKNNSVNNAQNQRLLERKIDELQEQREVQKKKYYENEQKLKQKISNLEKLSKEKDVKLSKLQKTLLDLKNYAVNESSKVDNNQMEQQLKDAVLNMTKGKTANDSKIEITLQKSLQTIQELTKKNRQYEQENRRLKQDKFAKTSFKK